MFPTTHALLVCVIFLCGLEETVLSQHGLCEGNQCFAIFQKPEDVPGAQKSCKEWDGQLYKAMLMQVLKSLLSGLSGSYWLEQPGMRTTAEDAAAGLHNCSSVSGKGRDLTFRRDPCHKRLNGYLCQYTIAQPCSPLQAGEGAQVTYTACMGFEVKDSAIFPPGTIAVKEKVGAKYPDAKHICNEMKWIQAPWSCEVMDGGCEYGCNSTTKSCICPERQTLHPNGITCTKDPCADCAQQCQKEGDTHVCRCNKGYRLAKDGKSCVDVDECKEESLCTGEGEECENTLGKYECKCKDGYEFEDGVCVDVGICEKCEHLMCDKNNGVYECMCRKGFKVSAHDPTKCEVNCTKRDCLARCIEEPGVEAKDKQCFCPEGYILDIQNKTAYCTDYNECESHEYCLKNNQKCENLFGSFRCVDEDGSGSASAAPQSSQSSPSLPASPSPPAPPASARPATLPPYVKTGSVLGITLFLALAAALVYFVVRNMIKRCGKTSFKRPDIDIFYLQQVTTETYKRLSFDKQFKNDSQRL